MSSPDLPLMVQILKALADESRLRILGLLATGEHSVEEIALAVGLRGPTVSHHLTRLREAGLVTMRAEGNSHLHALDRDRLRGLGEQLFAPGALPAPPPDDASERWERRVLSSFFEGDRLVEIPAARKKRDVILRWLLDRFAPDTRYTEPEVNQILARHHPDVATLRRELVGARLMRRERGVYWRTDRPVAEAAAPPEAPTP